LAAFFIFGVAYWPIASVCALQRHVRSGE